MVKKASQAWMCITPRKLCVPIMGQVLLSEATHQLVKQLASDFFQHLLQLAQHLCSE